MTKPRGRDGSQPPRATGNSVLSHIGQHFSFRQLVAYAVAAVQDEGDTQSPPVDPTVTAPLRDSSARPEKVTTPSRPAPLQNFFMLDNYDGPARAAAEEHHAAGSDDSIQQQSPKMGKPQSQPQPMGALYEDVENFFGDIFAWYGQFVARWPHFFVFIPLITCGLLGLGLFNLEYETQVENLYTPIGSRAAKDQAYLKSMYPDTSAHNFYRHQLVMKPTFGEVIVTVNRSVAADSPGNETGSEDGYSPSGDSVLSDDARESILLLYNFVYNVSIWENGELLSYQDVCAMRDGNCVVDGKDLINREVCVRPNDTANSEQTLAGVSYDNGCVSATVLKLRFNLRHNASEQREISLKWERQFLKECYHFHVEGLDFVYTVSESLDIELQKHVGKDTRFLGFSVLAMLVFATIIGSSGNCVTNHVTLAYAGVAGALLAIMAAFGLLSLMGSKFVNLCGVMPFLVLGVGADDMFQLMTEWRQSNIRDSISDRLSATLRSAAVSITITSLTDLLAFCIGATSPFVSVRNFCACSGVAIFICYINQLTFFSGCIVLNARRISASRHWLTCHKTISREEMREDGTNLLQVALCGGRPPQRIGEEGGFCRKFSKWINTVYPRMLLNGVAKCVVFVLFIAYFSLSVWGASQIGRGLQLESVVRPNSYLARFIQWDRGYFPNGGPVMMFSIHQAALYHKPEVQDDVHAFLRTVQASPYVVNGSQISWIDEYLLYREKRNLTAPASGREFVRTLTTEFLPERPEFAEDLKTNTHGDRVVASRFYVLCRKLNSSEVEGDFMLHMRHLANSSPLNTVAYSYDFVYYEHFVSILKNTLLPVGVTMIGMLFVALVFIPHPIAVTCVTLSMVSVVVGMVGFMHFWGLALSAITTIQIILSVGICVSFSVHISHAFMTATGKNRNERVTVALEKVGVPILNGALSSLFCAIMLSFGTSFIFTSFFKTMVLVCVLGVLHSLVFLPVMLSFIGPRRTSRPRVFIPISPSSRSLQDTLRHNSIIRAPPGISRRHSSRSLTSSDGLSENFSPGPTSPNDVTFVFTGGPREGSPPDDEMMAPRRRVSFNLGETPRIVTVADASEQTTLEIEGDSVNPSFCPDEEHSAEKHACVCKPPIETITMETIPEGDELEREEEKPLTGGSDT